MKSEPRFLPGFLLLLSGFLAWTLHFLLIYGFTGLLCARPEWAAMRIGGVGIVPLGIALMTVLALAALAAVLAWNGLLTLRGSARLSWPDWPFYGQVIQGGALLGAIAILWQGVLTIMLVPACGS